MKKLFEEYEIALIESDKANAAFENEPENADFEKAFDAAYKAEFDAFVNLAKGIEEITNGKINFETAKIMINTRFDDLKKLVLMLG